MVRAAAIAVVVWAAAGTAAAERVTQADLFRQLVDLERLTQPPTVGERTRMFSSYDRASQISDDGELLNWDANYDRGQFLRKDGDGWDVMAELDGPGAITRIWSANPEGRIQFVLDGDVVVDAPFGEIFHGKPWRLMDYNTQRGLTTYCPIGFGESCVVRIKDSTSYYQINTVSFAGGTTVERFDPHLSPAAQAAHDEVSAIFQNGFSYEQLAGGRGWKQTTTAAAPLPPLGVHELQLAGAGTLRALHCVVAEPNQPWPPYALHQCVLKIHVDGEDSPRVEAPLIDFFGSGFSPRGHHSLLMSVSQPTETPGVGRARQLVSFWPMPFDDGLRIEIVNLGRTPVGPLMLDVLHDECRPTADALRFNARYRTRNPATVLDFPVLTTDGPGRFVGLLLNIDCPRQEWWGEGDEKVWIDGERFPSYFGTGTEDYFNDAWGLRPHGHALHGVTRAGLYGKASMYRWHTADSIDFRTVLRFTIENWQHRKAYDTYYGTLAYWYARSRPELPSAPLEAADLQPPGLRIPNSIEVETNAAILRGRTRMVSQDQLRRELSGGLGVAVTGDHPMPVEINIATPLEGVYALRLRILADKPFKPFEVKTRAGRLLGMVRYDPSAHGWYDVGMVRFMPGDNVVRVWPKDDLVLDCWRWERVPRLPSSLEAEALAWSETTHHHEIQWGRSTWSGGEQVRLMLEPNEATTATLPGHDLGKFVGVTAVFTGDPNGGPVRVSVDGRTLETVNTQVPAAQRMAPYLGATTWQGGPHTITLRNVGSAPATFGLDAIVVRRVRALHALEGERMEVLGVEGFAPQNQVLGGGLSNDDHLFCTPQAPPAWIELALPVAKAGRYQLGIAYTRSFDYGIVQAYLDGEPIGPRVDTFGKLEPGPLTDLGAVELSAGRHTLRIELVGRHEESPGYFFGLDYVLLRPVGEPGEG